MPDTPSSPPPSGPFEGYICFAVYAAGLAINRFYKQLLDRLGLTYPQYLLLVALRFRDKQTVSELGEHMFLESNTLTPLIKRMEAAGLVTRQRDTKDERVVRVGLTEAGRALATQAECVPGDALAASGLEAEHLGRLAGELHEMSAHLRAATPG